jgi:hypothetical protein
MQISEMKSGQSYACKFRVHTFVDENNNPKDTKNLNIGETITDAAPGIYTGFGAISKRDTDKQLLEIVDLDNPGFTWTVSWSDVWDVDTLEYTD